MTVSSSRLRGPACSSQILEPLDIAEQHPEEGYVGKLSVIDVESEIGSPVRRLPGLGELGRFKSLDEKMLDFGELSAPKGFAEFGSQPLISGLGIGEIGPPSFFSELGGHSEIGTFGGMGGHSGIGSLGQIGGHPGLGSLGQMGGHPGLGSIGQIGGHPGIGSNVQMGGHPGLGSLGHMGGHPGLGSLGQMGGHPGLGSLGQIGGHPGIGSNVQMGGHPGLGSLGQIGGHPGLGSLGQIGGHPGLGELGAPRGHPGIGSLGDMGVHPSIGSPSQIGLGEPGPPKGHPGIGQLGPAMGGHPGLGQLGSTLGHPGLGMPPPSWNPPKDEEPGVIRIKTVGVLQPPSFSEDQSRPLALAMPLGSVPGHGEDPTALYRQTVDDAAVRRENVADGISDRDTEREMSDLEFALQNLNPTEVEMRRKMFHQQQYRSETSLILYIY